MRVLRAPQGPEGGFNKSGAALRVPWAPLDVLALMGALTVSTGLSGASWILGCHLLGVG